MFLFLVLLQYSNFYRHKVQQICSHCVAAAQLCADYVQTAHLSRH